MKKISIALILLLFAGTINVVAQNEQPADSIHSALPDNIKLFGDYMLDMSILMPPRLPAFNADPFSADLPRDYNALFQLSGTSTYSRVYTESFGLMHGYGMFSSSDYLYGASFKLNDKVLLNTYGQYDMYGRRVPNPNALPWEKNNFTGGMELKFNKNFGVRIEVQQRRNPNPY